MAEGTVNLRFSTKADSTGFNDLSKGFKKSAGEFKDFGDAGGKLVATLSAKFSGPLTDAMSGAFSIVRETVRGGLWGMFAAAAGKAIDFAVTKFDEAKAKASEVANIIRSESVVAMAAIGAKIGDLSLMMQSATKDADAMLAALNKKVVSDARHEIMRVNVEALQKMADGVTEAGKAVILAEKEYEIGMINARAAVEQATNTWKDAERRKEEAAARVSDAESALAEAEAAQALFVRDNQRLLDERARLEQALNTSYSEAIKQGYTENDARKRRAAWQAKLEEFDRDNATLLEHQKKINEGMNKAKALHTKMVEASAAADERYRQTGEEVTTAELGLKAASLKLGDVRQLQARAAAESVAADERAQIAEIEHTRQMEWQNRIYEVAKKAKIEAGELINRLNELMEDGCEDEEIRYELTQKYNEILGRLAKADEKNAVEAEKRAARKKKERDGIDISATMNANVVNTKEQARDVGDDQNFKEWKRNQRDDARKALSSGKTRAP